mgnify:CR=1 FL=1
MPAAFPSVFEFPSFADYFSQLMEAKRGRESRFSYRALARRLGKRSPSLLAMIARGERFPKELWDEYESLKKRLG